MANGTNYHQIADQIINEIKDGMLKPGDQLPPQREFAYSNHIAASTASRVYAELVKRGVAIGEVGRGTFIRAFDHFPPVHGEPATEPINLQLNFSTLSKQASEMIAGIKPLLRADILEAALKPVTVTKDRFNREITASFIKHKSWHPDPENILYTSGGRQGIASAMATIASPGDRIGIEYMTYPLVKGIAARLGITLVPLEMDEEGLCLRSLLRIHTKTPVKAIYIQPSIHNPLGINMSKQRRKDLAAYIKDNNIYAIEDAVYAFLADEMPFAYYAPQHTFFIDGLSKRLSPSLGYGFIICPDQFKEKCIAAIRTGGWAAGSIGLAICQRWIADGTVNRIAEQRKIDAQRRQIIAKDILAEFVIHTDPKSYHIWMELPHHWRADAFAAEVAHHGVAISPASVFAVEPGSAPNAIRLALAPPSIKDLKKGLCIVRDIARAKE